MNGATIIFYLLTALVLGSAILSVTTRLIFRAAVYLLFTLIGIAGIYFWLDYQFIAAVQIVVYVGGIVILIIFSIFLTQQAGEKMERQKLDRKIFAALTVFCGFALTMLQVVKNNFNIAQKTNNITVTDIGQQMLRTEDGGYALPFEVVSILLLAAMIGCIVIALKSKPE